MSPPSSSGELRALWRRGESLNLLLDYDGTLVPFASSPELASPDPALIALLRAVTKRRDTRVEIVSGRDRDTLGTWLGDLPIGLRAEHGMWTRPAGATEWRGHVDLDEKDVSRAAKLIEEVAVAHGGLVERKRAGVAWHYRGLDVREPLVDAVAARLALLARAFEYEVLRGSCVVELRPAAVHKGHAVRAAVDRHPHARIVALGDDVTDEAMFRALRPSDVGVLVGAPARPTAARLRVADVAACRALLTALA